jgi:hyperosmotically inducible protein
MSNLKNTFGRAAWLVSVALLCGGMAVAAPSASTTADTASPNRTAGQALDDSAVTAKIKAELIKDSTTKAYQIEVNSRKGVVQLNGFVDTTAARMRAGEIAKNISGVMEVQNNLEVKSGERTAGRTMDDAAITAKVKTALIEDSSTKAHQIDVTTDNGKVQLSGFVDSAAAKAQAAKLALQVNGVVSVQNNIDVKQ